ncbi:MAG: ABC transporter permease [Elusimicrobiota bacterium]
MTKTYLRTTGLLPVGAFVTCLFLIPLLNMFAYSFLTQKGFADASLPWTLANLIEAMTVKNLGIFLKSLAISTSVAMTAFVLGLGCAFHLAKRVSKRRQYVFLFLLTLPFWTSSLARLYGWYFFLGASGPLNGLMMWLGVTSKPLNLLFNEGAYFLGLLYNNITYMILPLYGIFAKIDDDLIQAATDLYASQWRLWTEVLIPMTSPGWIAGGLLVLISSLTDFVTAEVLCGSKNLFAANLIQNQFLVARNWPLGSAMALGFFILSLTALGAALLFVAHKIPYSMRRERWLATLGESLTNG